MFLPFQKAYVATISTKKIKVASTSYGTAVCRNNQIFVALFLYTAFAGT